MCAGPRVQMVVSISKPWRSARQDCVGQQYAESACRDADIDNSASHDAAVLCFSPGFHACVVHTIRLASSEFGCLFFPFWCLVILDAEGVVGRCSLPDSEGVYDCSQLSLLDGNALYSLMTLSLVSLQHGACMAACGHARGRAVGAGSGIRIPLVAA